MSGLSVRLEASADPRWEDLVAHDPASTFFHTPAWIEGLTAVYPYYRAAYLTARDDGGTLQGGLPVVRSVRFGLTQLLSLPYGTSGGPLARDDAAATVKEALVQAWLRETARLRVVRGNLVLSTGEDTPATLPAAVHRVEAEASVLRLPESRAALWEGFDGVVRTQCRKAERSGVTAREASDAEGGAALEAMYRAQSAGWSNHTPYPPGLIGRLLTSAPGRARVWAAYVDGNAVAAQLVFEHRENLMFWLLASRPEARRLSAVRLLYVAILEDAGQRGVRTADLGGNHGSNDLLVFKKAFGAVLERHSMLLVEKAWFRPLRLFQYRLRGLRDPDAV